ncbi:hypothetical protein C3B51_07360 [Pseudoalteromonas rubra]|uniref:Uncharacterized protein n=1 Tax=Pseudoalteromonas rubra TaxID=43658 RepID=A0A4Q7EJ23_9GAMM|nr:hypothetical protein [Pseudoalteromonas rubra]RZM83433.1 hypothetical protein C3B51_07360 [Pseudoalteromonas rubra]
MKLTIVFVLLSVFFAFVSIANVPRYGCFNGVCTDFLLMEFDVLGYIAISMFFAIISLKRLLKKTEIKQIHQKHRHPALYVLVMGP